MPRPFCYPEEACSRPFSIRSEPPCQSTGRSMLIYRIERTAESFALWRRVADDSASAKTSTNGGGDLSASRKPMQRALVSSVRRKSNLRLRKKWIEPAWNDRCGKGELLPLDDPLQKAWIALRSVCLCHFRNVSTWVLLQGGAGLLECFTFRECSDVHGVLKSDLVKVGHENRGKRIRRPFGLAPSR